MATIRMSCGDHFVDIAFDPHEVYTKESRDEWIATHGAVAYQELFSHGFAEKTSEMLRRLVREDGGKSPKEQIELITKQADELAAKGM